MKLPPAAARGRDGYTGAEEAVFFYTDTAAGRWTGIMSDDKKRARIALPAALPIEDGPTPTRTRTW